MMQQTSTVGMVDKKFNNCYFWCEYIDWIKLLTKEP